MTRFSTLVVALCLAAPSLAGEERTPGPETTGPPAGWLSDPEVPPRGLLDALVSGKVHLDDRLRVEWAKTTGRSSSTAVTNRLRLGYETRAFHGFSALVEMENVATPDADAYSVPPAGSGSPDRTVIADPPDTEVNQALVRFLSPALGDTGLTLDLLAGRQRLNLDDQRFVGGVAWRQLEQTFDAASVWLRGRNGRFHAFYSYVGGIRRIFGPEGPNPDSSSHLFNFSYRVGPALRIVPFAYLLDFEEDDPSNSVDSYGVRLTGDVGGDPEAPRDVSLAYELTYARQQDAGANPVDFQADFLAVQTRLARSGLGSLTAGYQRLGSDEGRFGFRFPLGTNHKFQGFADSFLVTPAEGVQDLHFGVGGTLPGGVQGLATYHRFWTDAGRVDLGSEIDLVASRAVTRLWSVLLKAAFFDGRSGEPETHKVWLQTELEF